MRYLSKLSLLLSLLVLSLATSLSAWADQCVPYCNVGHVPPIANSGNVIVSGEGGDVTAYFYGHIANDGDLIRMWDVTSGTLSPWIFNNQITKVGTQMDLGNVAKGDTLVFEIWNALQNSIQPGAAAIYYSQPNLNADDTSHFYNAPWQGGTVGGVYIPAGTFMGGEDMTLPYTDWDYNDSEFVFTITPAQGQDLGGGGINVATPEPGSLSLLLISVVGVGGTLRRRLGL